VRVSTEHRAGRSRFTVIVDDDGPGLTEEEREKAVKRGQRLDETKPGSGLGLSIVADLAHLYKGRFALEPSPEGGLRARLELPAA
jgi:signal transduction histidine kinase